MASILVGCASSSPLSAWSYDARVRALTRVQRCGKLGLYLRWALCLAPLKSGLSGKPTNFHVPLFRIDDVQAAWSANLFHTPISNQLAPGISVHAHLSNRAGGAVMEEMRLRLQLALDAARMSVWDSSVVGASVLDGVIDWSADGASLVGLRECPQTQPFRDFLRMVHPDDRQAMVQWMQQRVDECTDYHLEYRLIRPDGSIHWIEASGRCLCENGTPIRTLGLIRDITEQKLLELRLFEQKELAEVTLASIADAVITTDERGRTMYMNRVAEQLTGWSNKAARGKDISLVFNMPPAPPNEPMENIVHRCLRMSRGGSTSAHAHLVTSGGHHIPIEDSAAPIRSRDGKIIGVVVVFHDVSHERKLVQQLSWQASHDPLTGLINRREFEVSISESLRSARQDGHTHALLYMDLDRFKIVNDTCGHGAGDVLLQTLTRTLQGHMRESDVLARLGGDELGALLQCCPLQKAIDRANELRQAINNFRFLWGEHSFEIGASIGLVEIDDGSTSLTDLLVAADQACYFAKESGRNRVHVYRESDAILARRQGELQWRTRLQEAFAMDRFRLFAQPIVALSSNADGHEEVLIRLANDDNELTLPGAFIPAAERYDLMVPLDRWVIKHVCRYIGSAGKRETSTYPESYSVNLSGFSLTDEGMLDHILSQFKDYDVDPHQVSFEITETAIISNLLKAQDFMGELRKLGCRFSLDDFGSGLSSFAYLQSLPVDYLKIDGAFIRGIGSNKINRALVKSINEVGHVMGMQTVAEYVEDNDTLDIVRDLGIDYAQGYAVGHLRQLVRV